MLLVKARRILSIVLAATVWPLRASCPTLMLTDFQ